LSTDSTLVLGHLLLGDDDKDHEIPAAQRLIEELGLRGRLFTLDALHAQKNP
jgi:predicted transposase YbfD/YdcC